MAKQNKEQMYPICDIEMIETESEVTSKSLDITYLCTKCGHRSVRTRRLNDKK